MILALDETKLPWRNLVYFVRVREKKRTISRILNEFFRRLSEKIVWNDEESVRDRIGLLGGELGKNRLI